MIRIWHKGRIINLRQLAKEYNINYITLTNKKVRGKGKSYKEILEEYYNIKVDKIRER